MTMFVRTASERDLVAVRTLLVETWHDTYDAIYGPAKVTEITNEWHSLDALRRRLDAPRSEFLVADDGNAIAGMAFAQADESGSRVSLRSLYVRPSQQGRGIGGLLLDEVEDSFPEAQAFVLEVEAANDRAVRFYVGRGFVDDAAAREMQPDAVAGSTTRAMIFMRG